ncbi:MAG: hypothetical protein QOJ54_2769 [Aliidongia sp.]|jgi:hypothetical protein|nr:hypothetical protein [Aliidongia sp.]
MRKAESDEDIVREALHGVWYCAIAAILGLDLLLAMGLFSVPPASPDMRQMLEAALILSCAVPLSLGLSIYLERRR